MYLSAKDRNGEKAMFSPGKKFNDALRQVLSISKEELNRRLEADRLAKEGKPKRGPKPKTSSASDRVSDGTD